MKGVRVLGCIVILLSVTSVAADATDNCAWPNKYSENANNTMSALVLGGTGAVGHHIVQQLLASDQWTKVVTVGRREVPLPANLPGKDKLQQVTVNMDNLQQQAAAAFSGVDAVFCALGTTRADAGSAEVFKKVDHDYVAAAAAAAKAAGVSYFGLVSAQGANAGMPANDWKLFHGLLYAKTKGLAEESVKAQGFSRTAIFRPGMLDREEKARAIEKMFAPIMGSIAVSDVARVMIADAAAFKAGKVNGTSVFEMKEMQRAAAQAAK